MSALQTAAARLLLSHQTGKPPGNRGRDGTNSLLLQWITDVARVETSLLSHDCFFVWICLPLTLCPCPRPQNGCLCCGLLPHHSLLFSGRHGFGPCLSLSLMAAELAEMCHNDHMYYIQSQFSQDDEQRVESVNV